MMRILRTRVMVFVCGLVAAANVVLFILRPPSLSINEDDLKSSYEPLKLPDDEADRVAGKLRFDINLAVSSTTSKGWKDERLKSRSNTNKFLIHSFLRGGGGVLAEAFNLHMDDMFFLYQPLYKFEDDGPTSGIEVLSTQKAMKAMAWLKDAFNCSFEGHEDLVHAPYLWKSHSIRNTFKKSCQAKRVQMTRCLETACTERQLRAAFTIRLGIDHIAELIKQYGEEFKVVVVVRDPRAILSARRRERLGPVLDSPLTFRQQSAILCSSMAADLQMVHEVNERFPGSSMILRYEHLLLQPLEVLTNLYNFLGLDASYSHLYKVIRILKLDRPQQAMLETLKTWQVELSLRESRAIDQGCIHTYDKLGYFPVPNEVKNRDHFFISWEQAKDNHES